MAKKETITVQGTEIILLPRPAAFVMRCDVLKKQINEL